MFGVLFFQAPALVAKHENIRLVSHHGTVTYRLDPVCTAQERHM